MAKLERFCGEGIYDPPGYSQIVKATGLQAVLFTAGQVPYGPDGEVACRGDFAGQARHVFAAIRAHLEAAGAALTDVVKITAYVTDAHYRAEFRAVRREFFGDKGPGSTMVEVRALSHPDFMIEVEAIAVL